MSSKANGHVTESPSPRSFLAGRGGNIFLVRLPRTALVPRLFWAIIGSSLRDFGLARCARTKPGMNLEANGHAQEGSRD